jgi:hypothetical protein
MELQSWRIILMNKITGIIAAIIILANQSSQDPISATITQSTVSGTGGGGLPSSYVISIVVGILLLILFLSVLALKLVENCLCCDKKSQSGKSEGSSKSNNNKTKASAATGETPGTSA